MKKGIHHITAVAGDPQNNLSFYTGVLGMRMVKKTVNFDDPSTYHLYYGDETGRPGSILTFFPWSGMKQGKPGRGQVVAVSFLIPESSLDFWTEHLNKEELDLVTPFERFGKTTVGFRDPDGLHLELIADAEAETIKGYGSHKIPHNHAIRGFHGATLAEAKEGPTGTLLEKHLGFTKRGEEMGRHLYQTEADIGSTIEIIEGSELQGKPGKGTIHHIAFRSEDQNEQQSIRRNLLDDGYFTTDVKDRRYFRSVYFHEPGGVLFEVATDPPGFTVDEPAEHLGEDLKLPGWLEDRRELIEADLPELEMENG